MKCRGCGEMLAADISDLSPTAPGPMHTKCEFQRLTSLVEEQTEIANDLMAILHALHHWRGSWNVHDAAGYVSFRLSGSDGKFAHSFTTLEKLGQWLIGQEDSRETAPTAKFYQEFSKLELTNQRVSKLENQVQALNAVIMSQPKKDAGHHE